MWFLFSPFPPPLVLVGSVGLFSCKEFDVNLSLIFRLSFILYSFTLLVAETWLFNCSLNSLLQLPMPMPNSANGFSATKLGFNHQYFLQAVGRWWYPGTLRSWGWIHADTGRHWLWILCSLFTYELLVYVISELVQWHFSLQLLSSRALKGVGRCPCASPSALAVPPAMSPYRRDLVA